MSAAAVEAVRAGLRIAFERASVPATPPMRVAGQPSTLASGRAMLGATIATPRKRPRTPTTEHEETRPRRDARDEGADADEGERDRRRRASAIVGPKRASREGGSTDPSRTAAIGGTRVARSAGQRLARSVTRVPTTSETTTVRVAKTSPVSGRVDARRP